MKPPALHCAALALSVVCASSAFGDALPRVYPSGPSVPENLLRIELQLAKPLARPLDVEHVKLLNAQGQTIDGAFLDLPLPSADGLRVTLLLHPGRVKSGVGANRQWGRALQPGTQVTLRVDDPVLGAPINKSWRVAAADVTAPAPASWTLEAPHAGTRKALTVHLQAAISSTARTLIAVRTPDGQRLPGVATLGDFETTWRFVPLQPWKPGRYTLMVHPEMEDPSGNRACASFEVTRGSQADCTQETAQPFVVKAVLGAPPASPNNRKI